MGEFWVRFIDWVQLGAIFFIAAGISSYVKTPDYRPYPFTQEVLDPREEIYIKYFFIM